MDYSPILWNRSAMIEERLSSLGMLLIHRGTDYIPETHVIYHMKQNNWRISDGTLRFVWVRSFKVYTLFGTSLT